MDTKSTERMSTRPLPALTSDERQPVPAAEKQTLKERRELVKAIKAINATEFFGSNYELTFVLDRDTRKPLLRIVDRQTREVIRQLPPEYTLRLAKEVAGP